jgi:hypothetical protein
MYYNKKIIFCISIVIILIIIVRYLGFTHENFINKSTDIPIVIICWNNYYFVNNFIEQLKKYKNPIILLDNKSNYQPLLNYYKEIKKELGDRIEIRLLDENYGSNVYLTLKDTLPDIYILSDPDLELNKNMPDNFAEIFLKISNKYNCYKVGCSLSLDDKEKFIECESYTQGKNIYDWESQFWTKKINDDTYEMYHADIDTTFCLINNNNYSDNIYDGIRVAGNFTAKHLPWYKDYIKTNISQNEIENWKHNNISSSILFSCLQL